jgi:endoglucanase
MKAQGGSEFKCRRRVAYLAGTTVRALLTLGFGAAVVSVATLTACGQSPAPTPSAASSAPTPQSSQPGAPTAAAFVRVNQVGYPSGAAKRAYLMTRTAAAGAAFTVKNASGATVYSGTAGAGLGAWSRRFPHVYPLDFSSVAAAGSYTIVVSGPAAAMSPSFRIDSGTNVYAQALANSLSFYQVQRDGPNVITSALRTAAAHRNDANAMTYSTPKVDADGVFAGSLSPLGKRIDASGGWWDAGDYLKFVHASSYTEALLLTGVRDFPAQMGADSKTSDFTAEVRFGADWLLRMWDDKTRTLYYQVGIGSGNDTTAGDHDIWRLPQVDDKYKGNDPLYRYIRQRPVFRAGPPGSLISPNLSGREAVALALAYQVFKANDPAFADKCLLAAQHIFDLANTKPGRLMTAIPYEYYPETEWRDDLELGATELYFAVAGGNLPSGLPHTNAVYYLQRAAHWANAYISGPNDAMDTLNLYDVSGLAHFELYRAIEQAGDPAGLETSKEAVLADLKKQLDRALAQSAKDPFQFGFAWAQWDTTAHGAGLAVMASEYDQLTGTKAYADWSGRWLANILGANAWGSSFIVGNGTTFPYCLQHQVANLVGTLNGKPPVLAGASVEGPNSETDNGTMEEMRLGPRRDLFKQFNGQGAIWRDAVQNYPNTEPAIDLTAPSPLAFARMMAGLY